MAESPVSPLSSHASSEFVEDVKLEDRDGSLEADSTIMLPPTKRQKIGATSYRNTPQHDQDLAGNEYADDAISSDTSGSVPSSPITLPVGNNGPGGASAQQEDDHTEQVSVCKWRGCPAGDLGNMDVLVAHIHDEHIGTRQKRYACEWEDCSRIDVTHASGYALRAHMRSHTREKPFYCALPECDKSFTRSDALAKHMRTVHETEALRPSDPIPRFHSTKETKAPRIKLLLKRDQHDDIEVSSPNDTHNHHPQPEDYDPFHPIPAASASSYAANTLSSSSLSLPNSLSTSSTHFTPEELAMPPQKLYGLCRRQLHWAEREGERLRAEISELEAIRRNEWRAKELILANMIEAELAVASKGLDVESSSSRKKATALKDHLLPERVLPMAGGTPWYRKLADGASQDGTGASGNMKMEVDENQTKVSS